MRRVLFCARVVEQNKVVAGQELSFGPTGISRAKNAYSHGGFAQRTYFFDMGTTEVNAELLFMVLSRHFGPGTYDLVRKNCNHFTKCALEFLGCDGLPNHYLEMERMATALQSRAGLVQVATLGGYQPNPKADEFDSRSVMQNLRLQRSNMEETEYGPAPNYSSVA